MLKKRNGNWSEQSSSEGMLDSCMESQYIDKKTSQVTNAAFKEFQRSHSNFGDRKNHLDNAPRKENEDEINRQDNPEIFVNNRKFVDGLLDENEKASDRTVCSKTRQKYKKSLLTKSCEFKSAMNLSTKDMFRAYQTKKSYYSMVASEMVHAKRRKSHRILPLSRSASLGEVDQLDEDEIFDNQGENITREVPKISSENCMERRSVFYHRKCNFF